MIKKQKPRALQHISEHGGLKYEQKSCRYCGSTENIINQIALCNSAMFIPSNAKDKNKIIVFHKAVVCFLCASKVYETGFLKDIDAYNLTKKEVKALEVEIKQP